MQFENINSHIVSIIEHTVELEQKKWLDEKLTKIIAKKSKKELFVTYSLIASKIPPTPLNFDRSLNNTLTQYLQLQHANAQQLARIYTLAYVTEQNPAIFTPLVATIIQVTDTKELETFLKFLMLLPNPSNYQHIAVDALRTNIEPIFDAIALENPYPSLYFTSEQWNQMYLKAAFMQRDLSKIVAIDTMANAALSKIISDYAHERWKASRTVQPYFWRPISNFIDDNLLLDLEHLFNSSNISDTYVAALCCHHSDNSKAKQLLQSYPELHKKIKNKQLKWETITH